LRYATVAFFPTILITSCTYFKDYMGLMHKGRVFDIILLVDLPRFWRKSIILAKINYPATDAVFDQRAGEI
jgi:hypothetical protein